MTNVLFVCSANRLRSPTAEQIFSTWPGIETDSAGISSGANLAVALRVAKRLGAGTRVVTILVDSGLKYLSGDLYR